jgi:hypothetical protein
MSSKDIANCILSKINRLPKLTDVINKEMVFRYDQKKYYIKQWDYINFYYQIIQNKDQLFEKSISNFLPSFIEIIYKMALGETEDPDNWCTGQITLKPNKILQTGNKSFNYIFDKTSFKDFLEEFDTRLNETLCKFTSLALIYESPSFAHMNMILIYKEPRTKRLFLYLYEPEGSVHKEVENFLQYLISKFNETTEYKVERDTGLYPKSCPLVYMPNSQLSDGIQKLMKEKGVERSGQGYCVMYSYFWLYLVLSCSKDGLNPFGLMNTIENYLETEFTPSVISNIVASFASHAVNFYITDIQNYVDKDKLEQFHLLSVDMFGILMKNYVRTTSVRKKIELREDGYPCEENSECGSNYCDPISKICGPSELDEPIQLPSLKGPKSEVKFQEMYDSDYEIDTEQSEPESDIDM